MQADRGDSGDGCDRSDEPAASGSAANGAANVVQARQARHALLVEATAEDLAGWWGGLLARPSYDVLRAPEIGLVMLRGRIGGDGRPFNMGEATVTRAAIRLDSGETGFCYVLGRAPERAILIALADAMALSPLWTSAVSEGLLTKLDQRREQRKAEQREKTAATRVEFFTVARGED